VNFIDPDGEWAVALGAAIGAISGVISGSNSGLRGPDLWK